MSRSGRRSVADKNLANERFSWQRVCAGMYELRGTVWAIERRYHDGLWHVFDGQSNYGAQEHTLRDAKAFVESVESARRRGVPA